MNNASTSTRGQAVQRDQRPRKRGVAMVMVMIALMVGTIITLSFLSSQTTSMAIAHNANRQVQARAVAEDAVRLVIEHVRANVDWRDAHTHGVWTAATDLNGGSFRVMFEDDDDSDLGDDVSEPFVLTVEASFNGVVHRVSNRIVPAGVSSTMTVMLVTGNAYHADEDLLRIAMIESWGYTVVTVTDSDSQAVYDAAAAHADVIYISEESDSGSVGSKCNGYDIGVVNEEQAMQDDLKMSTGGGTYLGNAIDIIDNTHPITAGFSTGVVVITDNATGLIHASGTPAAGLTTLAERDGSSSKALTVLDVGDTMTDGNLSPQRRVTLPFGSNSFEFGHLNAAGQKLMKQAIVWAAAGQSDGEPGLSAQWVTFSGSLPGGTVDSLSWDDPFLVSVESQVNFPNTSSSSFSADGAVDRFGVRLTGTITIPSDGFWGFRLGSDDGSKLWIDGDLVVDHDGLHGFSNRDGLIELTSGLHDFEVQYFEQGGSQGLIAYWREPGSSTWEVIPESAFSTSELPEADAPNLLALYEFVEPEPVEPQLVGHWKLDEAPPSQAGGKVSMGGKLTMHNNALIDNYDASLGTYDSQTPGQSASVSTNRKGGGTVQMTSQSRIAGDLLIGVGGNVGNDVSIHSQNGAVVTGTIDELSSSVELTMPAPSGGGHDSDMTHNGGTHVISSDQRYKNWNLYNNANVHINGDVTITVSKSLQLSNGVIHVPEGSSLTLYVKKDVVMYNNSAINPDTSGPGRVLLSIHHNPNSDLTMTAQTVLCGEVYVAGELTLHSDAAIYGSVVVDDSITMTSQAAIHVNGTGAGSGGNTLAVDETGTSDGTYKGSAVGGQAAPVGLAGTAAMFDGNDSFIEVPHDDAYLLNKGTVSFWFYADDLNGTQGLVAKDANGYVTGGHFRAYTNGRSLVCQLQSTSASYTVQSSGSALNADTWHHVAVGFGAGGLRLYLDGVLVDSDSYTGGLGTSSGGVGNQEPWTFGVDQYQADSLTTDNWNHPYHGRIDDVRIYDQNLDGDQVADLHDGLDPGLATPAIVEDTSGVSPAMDLTITDPDNVTWISGGGLTIDSATSITSGGPVARLQSAIAESDRFTLEARFSPANTTQDGAARIVAYSNGTSNRNFHLGQIDETYDVRLRTESTPSGTPEPTSGNVLVADQIEHVLVTYDGEEIRVYRNGSLEITEEWTGDLDNWNAAYELLIGNEADGNRPWLGSLYRVAIYDGPINKVQADNIFNGDPPGDGTGGDEGLAYQVEWLESP